MPLPLLFFDRLLVCLPRALSYSGGGVWLLNHPTFQSDDRCDKRVTALSTSSISPMCINLHSHHSPSALYRTFIHVSSNSGGVADDVVDDHDALALSMNGSIMSATQHT